MKMSYTSYQLRHVAAIAALLIIMVTAATGLTAGKVDSTLADFQLEDNTIKGWTAADGGAVGFGPDELFDIINGGAEVYVNNGLVRGVHQILTKGDERQCEIFVEDFGSSEKAKKIFNVTTETASGSLKFDSEDRESIRINEFIGGIMVYMHHGNYYFEISVSGFDAVEEAGVSAGRFIDYFESVLSE